MKIKSESELAHILGTAFNAYANQVQRGLTHVWKPFLAEEDTVTVNVTLGEDGSLTISPLEAPEPTPTPEPEPEPEAEAEAEVVELPSLEEETKEEPVKPKVTVRRKKA